MDAPQNGIQRLKPQDIESLREVHVRSASLRRSGTPRRMDSRSFRPPPDAQESTKPHPPKEVVAAMMSSHMR